MLHHNCLQQTEEWFELKTNNPFSASNADAIATAGKGLETLVDDALTEKYSSAVKERYTNKDLERGNELEPQARAIYELENDVVVKEVGFITNANIAELSGVSPDGLVGDDGMIEIKSPNDKIYIAKLVELEIKKEFKIDSKYEWQMQMQMLFAERNWNDFMYYNPNFTVSILKKRIYEDKLKQQKIITGLYIGIKMYKEKEAIIKKALNIK